MLEQQAEVFTVVIERRSRFDPDKGPARGWLWGIAGVELARWRRRGAVAERAGRRLGIPVLAHDDEALSQVENVVAIASSWRTSTGPPFERL